MSTQQLLGGIALIAMTIILASCAPYKPPAAGKQAEQGSHDEHKEGLVAAASDKVTIVFDRANIDPKRKSENPPVLHIPRNKIAPPDIAEIGGQDQVARSVITVHIPLEETAIDAAYLEQPYLRLRISEVGNGVIEAWNYGIDSGLDKLHSGFDSEVGLPYIRIESSPGHKKRYRYYNEEIRQAGNEFFEMECVYYEGGRFEDACLIRVMPVPNLTALLFLKAGGARNWREIASEINKQVAVFSNLD